jgi:hypothetical protein
MRVCKLSSEEWISISCIGDDDEKEKFFEAIEEFANDLADEMCVSSKSVRG